MSRNLFRGRTIIMETIQNVQESVSLANSYIKREQYQEAIQVLETIINSGSKEGFIFLSLGEVYLSLSDECSNFKAKDYLIKAIEAATKAQDFQVIVAAKSILGSIYIQEAQDEFNNLREEEKWIELRERIPGLSEENLVNFSKRRRPVQFMFFRSNCKECQTSGSPSVPGRFVGFDDDCKGC